MKKFENPELSVYNFSAEDIITTSVDENIEADSGSETRVDNSTGASGIWS